MTADVTTNLDTVVHLVRRTLELTARPAVARRLKLTGERVKDSDRYCLTLTVGPGGPEIPTVNIDLMDLVTPRSAAAEAQRIAGRLFGYLEDAGLTIEQEPE